jgi:hypothetical protein
MGSCSSMSCLPCRCRLSEQLRILPSLLAMSGPVSVLLLSLPWLQCISPSVLPSGSVVPSSAYTSGVLLSGSYSRPFSTMRPRTDLITPRIAFPSPSSLFGQQFLLVEWPSFPRCVVSPRFTLELHASKIIPVTSLVDQEES